LPPSVEETPAFVELIIVPAYAPVTVTLKVQLLFAANDPPEKETVLGIVVESEPPQVEVGPLVATVTPAGKISVNPIPFSELDRFGLVMMKVSVVSLPVKIEPGENDLAREVGAITVMESVA